MKVNSRYLLLLIFKEKFAVLYFTDSNIWKNKIRTGIDDENLTSRLNFEKNRYLKSIYISFQEFTVIYAFFLLSPPSR